MGRRTVMANQTRFYRREVYRPARRIRKSQVRRTLRALEALYRR
jgi:hypothetical protein